MIGRAEARQIMILKRYNFNSVQHQMLSALIAITASVPVRHTGALPANKLAYV
jgi:hypothetical protein